MLDLSKWTAKIGQLFQSELQNNIRSQKDISGANFIPVKQSTAISRQRANNTRRKKGTTVGGNTKNRKAIKIGQIAPGKYAKSGLDFKRLLFTGRFWQNAFKSEARKDEVRVSVNDSYYTVAAKTRVTYRQIVRWNNAGSPEVNRKILKPPLIFPRSEADVQKMKAFGLSQRLLASPEFQRDIKQQVFENALKKQTFNVSIGCVAAFLLFCSAANAQSYGGLTTTQNLHFPPSEIGSRWETTIANIGDSTCSHNWAEAPKWRNPYGGMISCAVMHGELGCPNNWGHKEQICRKCYRKEVLNEVRYFTDQRQRRLDAESEAAAEWLALDSLARKK